MTELFVTDLTRMGGEHICLAGYELVDGRPERCIRPELRYEALTEGWLYGARWTVRAFSIVDFTLIAPRPAPPHTEDWVVDRRFRIVEPCAASLAAGVLEATCSPSVAGIFAGELLFERGWFVPPGTGPRSLGTVLLANLSGVTYRERPERGRWEYRLAFRDEAGEHFDLPITDLALRYWLDASRLQGDLAPDRRAASLEAALREAERVYLRIGLTRPFGEGTKRCFAQVTGVHSFPDYLDGASHEDLNPIDLRELPRVPF